MSEAVDNGITAGTLLREARQAYGMHIAALAVALKVPVSKLEALEADDHAALPDIVFVRALASSVCRMLKMDPVPVLARLPQSESPRLSANNAGLNAPVKGRFGKTAGMSASSFSGPRSTSQPFAFVVLILLLGALALYYYPRHKEQAPDAVVIPLDAVPGASSDVVLPALSVADLPASGVVPPSPVQAVVDAPVLPASSALIPVAPAAVASTASTSVASAAGVLVLRARSESWVQVRDGTGMVVLQRNLAAGESVSVGAPAPLTVVIGRADVTEVTVRGKPFDLMPVTRENVARFEVK